MPEIIDGIYLNAYLTESQIAVNVNKDRETVYVTDWESNGIIGNDTRLADFTPAYEIEIGGTTYRRNIVTWEALNQAGGLGLKYIEDGDTLGVVRSRDPDSSRGAQVGYVEGEFSYILGDNTRGEGEFGNFVSGYNTYVKNSLSNMSIAVSNYGVIDNRHQSLVLGGGNNGQFKVPIEYVVKSLVTATPTYDTEHDLFCVSAPFLSNNIGDIIATNTTLGPLNDGDYIYSIDNQQYYQFTGGIMVASPQSDWTNDTLDYASFNSVIGGWRNTIVDEFNQGSSILGGFRNRIGKENTYSLILGGYHNLMNTGGSSGTQINNIIGSESTELTSVGFTSIISSYNVKVTSDVTITSQGNSIIGTQDSIMRGAPSYNIMIGSYQSIIDDMSLFTSNKHTIISSRWSKIDVNGDNGLIIGSDAARIQSDGVPTCNRNSIVQSAGTLASDDDMETVPNVPNTPGAGGPDGYTSRIYNCAQSILYNSMSSRILNNGTTFGTQPMIGLSVVCTHDALIERWTPFSSIRNSLSVQISAGDANEGGGGDGSKYSTIMASNDAGIVGYAPNSYMIGHAGGNVHSGSPTSNSTHGINSYRWNVDIDGNTFGNGEINASYTGILSSEKVKIATGSKYSSIMHSYKSVISNYSYASNINNSELSDIDNMSIRSSIENSWSSNIDNNSLSTILNSERSNITQTNVEYVVLSILDTPPSQVELDNLGGQVYFAIGDETAWVSQDPAAAGKQIARYTRWFDRNFVAVGTVTQERETWDYFNISVDKYIRVLDENPINPDSLLVQLSALGKSYRLSSSLPNVWDDVPLGWNQYNSIISGNFNNITNSTSSSILGGESNTIDSYNALEFTFDASLVNVVTDEITPIGGVADFIVGDTIFIRPIEAATSATTNFGPLEGEYKVGTIGASTITVTLTSGANVDITVIGSGICSLELMTNDTASGFGTGGFNAIVSGNTNKITGGGKYQFIGTGYGQTINSPDAIILGGIRNTIEDTIDKQKTSSVSFIGSGNLNLIHGSSAATILNGTSNTIYGSFSNVSDASVILSGKQNLIHLTEGESLIGTSENTLIGALPFTYKLNATNITVGSPGTINDTNADNISENQAIIFYGIDDVTSSSAPENWLEIDGILVRPGQIYYAVNVTATTYQVSISPAGTPVSIQVVGVVDSNKQFSTSLPDTSVSYYSASIAGFRNTIIGRSSFIGTGGSNTIKGDRSTILNGADNLIGIDGAGSFADDNFIVSGFNHKITGISSINTCGILGGVANEIINSDSSLIGIAYNSSINSTGGNNIILGGESAHIGIWDRNIATCGDFVLGTTYSPISCTIISGGAGDISPGCDERVITGNVIFDGIHSTIVNGVGNYIWGDASALSIIASGRENTLVHASSSAILSGNQNKIGTPTNGGNNVFGLVVKSVDDVGNTLSIDRNYYSEGLIAVGDVITLLSTGTVPSPLVSNRPYVILNITEFGSGVQDEVKVQLGDSLAGVTGTPTSIGTAYSPIDFTDAGTGIISIFFRTDSTDASSILGGLQNVTYSAETTISGGSANFIDAFSSYSEIIGGMANLIGVTETGTSAAENVIINGDGNRILDMGTGAIIQGRNNKILGDTAATSSFDTIINGSGNRIEHVSTAGTGNAIIASNNVVMTGTADHNIVIGNYTNAILSGNTRAIVLGNHPGPYVDATVHIENLDTTGNVNVGGTLSKSAGTFKINHPVPEKSDTHYLYHSFVESPNAGDNLYTYEVTASNNGEVVCIELPDYWSYLNDNPRLFIQAKDMFAHAFGKVNGNVLEVTCEKLGVYDVLLIGTRKDKAAVDAWKGVERKK